MKIKIALLISLIYSFLNCSLDLKKLAVVHRNEFNILNDSWTISSPFYSLIFSLLHKFDARKYEKIVKYLRSSKNRAYFQFYSPEEMISDSELLKVHTQEYLDSLSEVENICEILCVPAIPFILTMNNLTRFVLNPMRWGTAGTLLASDLAVSQGFAVNLSGGYHHAKPHKGEGFCVYADIPLAIQRLRTEYGIKKILYVDLDAHQGNGVEAYKKRFNDEQLYVLDAFNLDNYPSETVLFNQINYILPLVCYPSFKVYNANQLKSFYERLLLNQLGESVTVYSMEGENYNALVEKALDNSLNEVSPDFIIYNAGTDILDGDKLGRLNVSFDDVVQRDLMVFRKARDRKIPILMLLSGGYTLMSAEVIKESLVRIATEILN